MDIHGLLNREQAERRENDTSGLQVASHNDSLNRGLEGGDEPIVKQPDMADEIRKMRQEVKGKYKVDREQLSREHRREKVDFRRDWKKREDEIKQALKQGGEKRRKLLRAAGVSQSREHRLDPEKADRIVWQEHMKDKNLAYRHLERQNSKSIRSLGRQRDENISRGRTELRRDVRFM